MPSGQASARSRLGARLLLVTLLALALRLAMVGEIAIADLDLTPHAGTDMMVYWENAGRIAGGDLLLSRGYVHWEKYLDDLLGAERRARLYGDHTYYNAPFYMYFLAAVRMAYGNDPHAVLFLQAVLSASMVPLVYALARLMFDGAEAWVAALAVACQDTLIFYTGFVLRETLYLFFATAAALLFMLATRRDGRMWPLAAGLVAGLAWLTKSEVSFMLPFFFLALLHRATVRVFVGRAMIAAGGLALALLPFVARNLSLGVPPLQMSCFELEGVIRTNLPGCPPKHQWVDVEEVRSVVEATDGRFVAAVGETLRRHGTPGSYLLFVGRKLVAFWNAYEPWNNAHLIYFRRILQVFRLPLVTAGVLLPLSLVGLVLDLRNLRAHLAAYGMVLGAITFTVLSFVLDRYRMAAYPALAIFGAHAVLFLTREARASRWTRAVAVAALVLVLGFSMRDRESQLYIDRLAREHRGTYLSLNRPWAAAYVTRHARRPTPFEEALQRQLLPEAGTAVPTR